MPVILLAPGDGWILWVRQITASQSKKCNKNKGHLENTEMGYLSQGTRKASGREGVTFQVRLRRQAGNSQLTMEPGVDRLCSEDREEHELSQT